MKIVTCDPGITGSLVIINNRQIEKLYDMPTIKVGSKTRVDPLMVADIFNGHQVDAVVVEHVGASPRMGVSSAFGFGMSFATLLGVAAGLGLPCHTITPQRWKTFHGLLGKPKDASRLKVIGMFPEWKDSFKFKKSVDSCDAILLGLAWLGRK